MIIREHRRRNLTVSILSLSLLTVMAGAAVAPALNTIKAYFSMWLAEAWPEYLTISM